MAAAWCAAAAAPGAHAYELGVAWTGDFLAVTQGGLEQGETHLGMFEASFHTSLVAWGGPEMQVHLVAQHTYGGGVSDELVGDLQTVSNIDAEPGTRLLEAWVDVPVTTRWSVRLGKYDLNTEFDAIEAAGLFLSSSQGVGPELSQSGARGPSIFPQTAFGLRVEHRTDTTSWRGALLDVAAEAGTDPSDWPYDRDAMLAVELERESGASKFKLGAWGYVNPRATIRDPQREEPEYGGYVSVVRPLAAGWQGYARWGAANAAVDRIGQYAGLGLVAEQGLLPRHEDTLGMALGYARNGRAWRDAAAAAGTPVDAAELAIEVTWRIPVGEHLFVQPDLQYVLNPNTDPSIDDAVVIGVRIEAAFGYSPRD